MVIGVWVVTALVVGIPNIVHRNEEYYGDTKFCTPVSLSRHVIFLCTKRTIPSIGCWIPSRFRTEQLLSEYLWVWLAAFSMIILYGIMFLVMRGFILIENGIHWRTSKNRVHLDLDEAETEDERETRAIANLLLLCVSQTSFFYHLLPLTAIPFIQLPSSLRDLCASKQPRQVAHIRRRNRPTSIHPLRKRPLRLLRDVQCHPLRLYAARARGWPDSCRQL